jgi:hypothetical protein
MDRLTSLALIGLLGSTFLACGTDENPRQRINTMAPDAGTGAMGGTGGITGAGGGGGTAGSTGVVVPPVPAFTGIATCSQCVEVEVPVSGGNTEANLLDQVGFPFYYAAPGQDFSNITVTWRVMALENNPDLMVAPYIEQGAPYAGVYGALISLSEQNFPPGQWVDVLFDMARVPLPPALPDGGVDAGVIADAGGPVVVDAGALLDGGADAGFDDGDPAASAFRLIDPGFDKRLIEQLGLYVGSAATLQGDAVAKVAIDSVTFTGTPTRANILFDTGLQALTKNTFNEPPGTQGPVWHP